jgi:hypothetical protein
MLTPFNNKTLQILSTIFTLLLFQGTSHVRDLPGLEYSRTKLGWHKFILSPSLYACWVNLNNFTLMEFHLQVHLLADLHICNFILQSVYNYIIYFKKTLLLYMQVLGKSN